MKFAVDNMLGSLARWLRMLGYTVAYKPKSSDNELLTVATTNGMALLTRDEELHRRALSKKIPSFLVAGENEPERLAYLSKSLGISLNIDMERTLCPECGHGLVEVRKESLSGEVPDASLKLYNQFWRCTNLQCRKTYWMGSHWKQINETLSKARQLAG